MSHITRTLLQDNKSLDFHFEVFPDPDNPNMVRFRGSFVGPGEATIYYIFIVSNEGELRWIDETSFPQWVRDFKTEFFRVISEFIPN